MNLKNTHKVQFTRSYKCLMTHNMLISTMTELKSDNKTKQSSVKILSQF